MELLKKLDIRVIGVRPDGKARKERYGLFECPICKNHVECPTTKGKKMKTCTDKKCMYKQKSATLTTHGLTHTKIYRVWANMKQRCTNIKSKHYKFYGAKGITYDPTWESLTNFLADMQDTYKEGLELDRKDNKGNYCKENCQWISKAENSSKDKTKAVAKYDLQNKFISEYPSAKVAAEVEGYTNQHGITRCARGERKRYLNHIWKWV